MNKEKQMTDEEHISSNVGCNAIGDNDRYARTYKHDAEQPFTQ